MDPNNQCTGMTLDNVRCENSRNCKANHPRRVREPKNTAQINAAAAALAQPVETESISVTDTAKFVRRAVKDNFKADWPDTKFSVRSSSYSGGASIDVSWTDGPPEKEVQEVVGVFAGATFDSMQDMKVYHTTLLANEDGTVRDVRFGANFVFANRRVSEDLLTDLEPHIPQDGLTRGDEQCDVCMKLMPEGNCYTAEVSAGGNERIVFCCSPRCGARRAAEDPKMLEKVRS